MRLIRLARVTASTTVRVAAGIARAASVAVCLAGLLAAAGVAWAWWHAGHVREDRVELVASRRFVSIVSTRAGIDVFVVKGWPWPMAGQLTATSSRHEDEELATFRFAMAQDWGVFRIPLGPEVMNGRHQVWLSPPVPQSLRGDGWVAVEKFDRLVPPQRVTSADFQVATASPESEEDAARLAERWSPSVETAHFERLPHAVPIALLLLPTSAMTLLVLGRVIADVGFRAGMRWGCRPPTPAGPPQPAGPASPADLPRIPATATE